MPCRLFDVAQNHVGAGAFLLASSALPTLKRATSGGLEQRGLGKFAIKLGNFKLIGLIVMAEQPGGFNRFFPIPVLLVDIEQVLSWLDAPFHRLAAAKKSVPFDRPTPRFGSFAPIQTGLLSRAFRGPYLENRALSGVF